MMLRSVYTRRTHRLMVSWRVQGFALGVIAGLPLGALAARYL